MRRRTRFVHREWHDQPHTHHPVRPQSRSSPTPVRRLRQRRHIDRVLAELSVDVDWAAEAAGTAVPWWGSFRGKDEVPRFFEEIHTSIEVTEFSVLGFTPTTPTSSPPSTGATPSTRPARPRRCTCSTGSDSPPTRSCSSGVRRTPTSRQLRSHDHLHHEARRAGPGPASGGEGPRRYRRCADDGRFSRVGRAHGATRRTRRSVSRRCSLGRRTVRGKGEPA